MLEICYYSSDFYAPYTGISMLSLCQNNRDLDFRIHCIDAGISDENKENMRRVAAEYGRELILHDFTQFERHMRDDLGLPECSGSYATYIKVYPEMMFPDMDSILFLDGDTIVRGSVAELAEMDMNRYLFSAVKVTLFYDETLYANPGPWHHQYVRYQYSLKFAQTGYFNIGVMFVNLQKWKALDVGRRIIESRTKYPDLLADADIPVDEMLFNLTILNDVGMEQVLELHPKFNSIAHFLPYRISYHLNSLCKYLDMSKFKEAYRNAVVVHFIMYKPWNSDMYSRYRHELKRYIAHSPWQHPHTEERYPGLRKKLFRYIIYPFPYNRMKMWYRYDVTKLYIRKVQAKGKSALGKTGGAVKSVRRILRKLCTGSIRRGKFLLTGNFRNAFEIPRFLKKQP